MLAVKEYYKNKHSSIAQLTGRVIVNQNIGKKEVYSIWNIVPMFWTCLI